MSVAGYFLFTCSVTYARNSSLQISHHRCFASFEIASSRQSEYFKYLGKRALIEQSTGIVLQGQLRDKWLLEFGQYSFSFCYLVQIKVFCSGAVTDYVYHSSSCIPSPVIISEFVVSCKVSLPLFYECFFYLFWYFSHILVKVSVKGSQTESSVAQDRRAITPRFSPSTRFELVIYDV